MTTKIKLDKSKKKWFKKTTHLNGPTNITYLKSKKYDKKILLVADLHEPPKNTVCIDEDTKPWFHEYLDEYLSLIKEGNVDYFLERGFYTEDHYKKDKEESTKGDILEDAYIRTFSNHYQEKGCFILKKNKLEQCKKNYPNVRFHLSDVRHNQIGYKVPKEYVANSVLDFYNMMNTFEINAMDIPKNTLIEDSKDKKFVAKKIIDYRFDKEGKKFYRQFSSFTKYFKEMKKVLTSNIYESQLKKVDPKIRKKLERLRNKKLREFKKDVTQSNKDKYKRAFKQMMDYSTKKNFNFYKIFTAGGGGILKLINNYHTFVMDFFIICRIFKKFNDKKNPHATNVIIHAGQYHIDTIKQILQDTFKIKVYKDISGIKDKKRCLDIKDLKLPFFK